MSTDECSKRLDELDKERSSLIKKLPWYKKFYRRFMTGDSFWAWNLSSVQTCLTAFPAGLAVGLSSASFASTYPTAWGVGVKAVSVVQSGWGYATAFVAGLAKVGFSVSN